jgi:predicted dehydrogenase
VQVEVVEPAAEAIARAGPDIARLRAHPTLDEALATAPDVVWLATPTELHAAQAIAGLKAGCHVFCEKPMSDSLQNAYPMLEAANASGRVFNVGFMWRFSPAMRALRASIQGGELGRVLHAHVRVGTYVTLMNSGSRYQARQPGSLFLDYSHQPDILYWLFGQAPHSVSVTAFQGGELELTSDPNVAVVVCEYDGPMISTTHLNYVQMPHLHDYEIVGDRGWAQLSFPTGLLSVHPNDGGPARTESHPPVADDLYRAEQAAFLEAIAGTREPETSAADGLISTAICDACVRSWRSRERMVVQREVIGAARAPPA